MVLSSGRRPAGAGGERTMRTRVWLGWMAALGVAALLLDMQGYVAEAGTIAGGTAITLGGLDSFAATVQTYAKGNIGKMIGMIIAIGGIAAMAFSKIGMGLCGLGAGIAIAFVPNIIGTAFDTTAASPVATSAPFVALAAGGGVVNLLAQVGLALLWPVMALVKYGRDPVVWVALGLVAAARPSAVVGVLSLRAWAATAAGRRPARARG